MEIKDFISVYDDVMALSTTGNFLKFCNKISFAEQKVLTPLNENRLDKLDKKTRSTKGYGLRTDGESLTEAHWCNVYSYLIEQIFRNYDRNLPFKSGIQRIDEINVLKYEKDDFYVAHTDSFLTIPRTLSIVIFLNDDYEGGELVFHCPRTRQPYMSIPPKSNRLVIFPSNFLYPHSVNKVNKGVRYSIVSWMV